MALGPFVKADHAPDLVYGHKTLLFDCAHKVTIWQWKQNPVDAVDSRRDCPYLQL
jgi:hypothetical protein